MKLLQFPICWPLNGLFVHWSRGWGVLSFSERLVKYLTFKIQGQSHSSRSHNRYNILLTHIPFIPCWSALPFLRCSYLKKLTLKIQCQGHGWGHSSKSQCKSNILLTRIPFIPCQSGNPLMSYDFFKIWPWNSRVKVMDEVTVQSHNVGVTSYRLTSLSFHVNRPSHSWDTAFSKFDLENQGSRSWVRSQFNFTMWV